MVVVERRQRHQTLDEHLFQFHEEAEFGHADDQSLELFADAVLHELHLLPFQQFAFGVGGHALGAAGTVGDFVQFVFRHRPAQRRSALDASLAALAFGPALRPGRRVLLGKRRRDAALAAFTQNGFEHTMHDQVGIAPDGRGEMRISRRRQSEVALVFLGVTRLLQRAQHEVRQNALFRGAGDFLHQLLIHARRDVDFFGQLDHGRAASGAAVGTLVGAGLHPLHRQSAHAQRIAEARGDVLKLKNLLRIGLFVDAIQAGHAPSLQMAGDRLVGGQHELLDQPMGLVAL